MSTRTISSLAALIALAAGSGALAEPAGAYLESTTYPIRVFYDVDTEPAADDALALAEDAWAQEVVGMEFSPPLRTVGVDDDVQVGFDLVLDNSIGGAATYMITADNPDTAITDCATVGVVNPSALTTLTLLEMGVLHIFNHNALHATDCIEPQNPAYDMFSAAVEVAIMGADHPYWIMMTIGELPTFQAHPWYSIDAVPASGSELFYTYGSALFPMLVDEVWGDGDGLLLSSIWARTAQDGTITSFSPMPVADVENEPDFLDAIAAEATAQGSSFDEAFVLLTEYRFFVGTDDDGAHFDLAAAWEGGEVKRDTQLVASDLPVEGGAPEHLVAEYGASYVEIDPAGLPSPQEAIVSFSGNTAKAWAASLYLVPADGAATIVPISLDADRSGEAAIEDASAWSRIVLAVANLGDGAHDADDGDWGDENGDYAYSIATPGYGDPDAGADGGDADADADTDAGADAGQGSGSSGCGCMVSGPAPSSLLTALLAACL